MNFISHKIDKIDINTFYTNFLSKLNRQEQIKRYFLSSLKSVFRSYDITQYFKII